MKCPACGDSQQQENIGRVQRHQAEPEQPTPILYHCGSCDFLYTLPPLKEHTRAKSDG